VAASHIAAQHLPWDLVRPPQWRS